MKFKKFLDESQTGLGADGISKQKLKTMLYKETKKCTFNKLYKDQSWEGVKCIWNIFDKLNLNWDMTKAEYKRAGNKDEMPTGKEWHFEIQWDDDKGKHKKLGGYVVAAGAGSVKDPLDKYDLNMILF